MIDTVITNGPVRAFRPTDNITRAAFKQIGVTIIEPDEDDVDCHERDWHVIYAEDIAAIMKRFGATAFGFKFWYVQNGRAWYMDFAGTGGYEAPEIDAPPVMERR